MLNLNDLQESFFTFMIEFLAKFSLKISEFGCMPVAFHDR